MARLDRRTFEQLVREHHVAVYRRAHRIVQSRSDAEDVTQSVFVKVLEGGVDLAAAQSPEHVLCWLATKLALNQLRGARRRTDHERRAAMSEPALPPPHAAAASEQRRLLRQSLSALPEPMRVPLVLRYQEGLTLAAVGEALGVPESTVHDRVQRGLRTLRDRLKRAGFAVAAVELPDRIAVLEPVSVPASLQGSLLGLTEGTAASGAGKLAAALSLVLVGGGIGWASWPDAAALVPVGARAVEPRVTAAPSEPVPAERTELAHAPGGARTADRPDQRTARVSGSVRDADGWAVAGAAVHARSAESSKAPRFEADAVTSAAGEFGLALTVPAGVEAQDYVVTVSKSGRRLLETAPIAVRATAAAAALDLTLPRSSGVAGDHYEWRLTVVGADGRPIRDARVQLFARDGATLRVPARAPELEVRTDQRGIAMLESQLLGDKLLYVHARSQGGRPHLAAVSVDRPGPRESTVRLRSGRKLAVRATRIDGRAPDHADVSLIDEDTGIRHWADRERGRFEFRDLDDGTYTLRGRGYRLSGLELRGVRADDSPVELRFKAESDPRDVGMHLAEFHGRLRDAASVEWIGVRSWDVESSPLAAGESTSWFDLIEPPRLAQRQADPEVRSGFHVTGLRPGRHALVARVRGYAATVVPVTVTDDRVRTDVVIELHRGGSVAGRVLDAAGEPVARGLLFVVGVGATADGIIEAWDREYQLAESRRGFPSALVASSYPSETGEFALHRVPPGVLLRVVAVAPGARRAVGTPWQLRDGERRRGLRLHLTAR